MAHTSLTIPALSGDKRYSSLAEEIRHLLLDTFINGELAPGMRVNDIELAKKLGVSRTPVREALRGLQALGIIETLPARITRVVTLNAEEFEQAKLVWATLYDILLTEIIHHTTDSHINEMATIGKNFTHVNRHKFSPLSFRFFHILTALTDNAFLKESIHAAACRMRLGHPGEYNTDCVNPTPLEATQFIDGVANKNLPAARHALSQITNVSTQLVNRVTSVASVENTHFVRRPEMVLN